MKLRSSCWCNDTPPTHPAANKPVQHTTWVNLSVFEVSKQKYFQLRAHLIFTTTKLEKPVVDDDWMSPLVVATL